MELIKGWHILLVTGNIMAKFYLNKQGGTGSIHLCRKATLIWQWTINQGVQLTTIHIACQDNTIADSLSRDRDINQEWSIADDYLDPVFMEWRAPEIALFTSMTTAKCWFCSRAAVSQNSIGDAFQLWWHGPLFYGFPPFEILHRVVAKLKAGKATWILLTHSGPGGCDFSHYEWWPRECTEPYLQQTTSFT